MEFDDAARLALEHDGHAPPEIRCDNRHTAIPFVKVLPRARADSIARAAAESAAAPLAGMPPVDSTDVYAAAAAGMVDSVEAAGQPAVYVPLGGAGSVAVIDPR